MKKFCVYVMALCAIVQMGYAQSRSLSDDGYNKNSIKQIPEAHIMFKKTMWRMMDLREKQNQPFFANGQEITQVIIDAVKAGKIQPWMSDSLAEGSPMTVEQFTEKLEIPAIDDGYTEEEEAFLTDSEGEKDPFGISDFFPEETSDGGDPLWDDVVLDEPEKKVAQTFYYEGKDLWQLEIKEDLIFDKQHSMMVHDIQALTLVIPADHPDNVRGIEETVASFSYKDLVENVFQSNPKAIWYNPYNDKEHKSLADAFELRLFSSYITKVSNPLNERLSDTYGNPAAGLRAAQDEEYKLLEFEHNLWSY